MRTPDVPAVPSPGSDQVPLPTNRPTRHSSRMLAPGFVLAVAATFGACGDATGPTADASAAPALMSASSHVGASIVLDDAASRIVSAVENAEHRGRLIHLLEQLQRAVATEDLAAARRLVASTRTELARGSVDPSEADALIISLDAVDAELSSADARPSAATHASSSSY